MYESRQLIYRTRLGESECTIARAGLMGRRKAAELRQLPKEHGMLDKMPLTVNTELAVSLNPNWQQNQNYCCLCRMPMRLGVGAVKFKVSSPPDA